VRLCLKALSIIQTSIASERAISAAWAVQGAIVPFGATTLPLLGIGFIADERIERIKSPDSGSPR